MPQGVARGPLLYAAFAKSPGEDSLDSPPCVGLAIHSQKDIFVSISALHNGLQVFSKRFREDRDTIFVLFGIDNSDGQGREIEIPNFECAPARVPECQSRTAWRSSGGASDCGSWREGAGRQIYQEKRGGRVSGGSCRSRRGRVWRTPDRRTA